MSVSNERGFTLLEILIAITLLAFITIGIVSITDNAVETKDRTTEINKSNLQVETALSRFEWDFSQIYSPLYFSKVMNMNQNLTQMSDGTTTSDGDGGGTTSKPSAEDQPTFNPALQQYYETLVQRFERNEHFQAVSQEGLPIPRFYAPDKSTFEFFTSSNRRKVQNTRQSHFGWVRYALAQQEEIPGEDNPAIPKNLKSFVRYYTADDPYSDKRINIDNVDRVKGAVLLRNVEALEFQYWDYNRRKWETSLKTIPNGENIVRGVKMIITFYDSSANKRTTTRIFRTNWPMVAPQDQATVPASRNTGGTTTSGTTGNQDSDGI